MPRKVIKEAIDLYNSTDTAALNTARLAGFDTLSIDIVETSNLLSKLRCPLEPTCDEPSKVLAGAIEALDRFSANSTVWLEIEGGLYVPSYVTEAIKSLAGIGTRLIVTCGPASTHLPGPLLNTDLIEAVSAANVGAHLWHPLEKITVPGCPSR